MNDETVHISIDKCTHDFGDTWWAELMALGVATLICRKCGLTRQVTNRVPDWLKHYGQCCEALGLDMIVFADLCKKHGLDGHTAYLIVKEYCETFDKLAQ